MKENDKRREKVSTKAAPFYKIIENTNLAVDAFYYGDLPSVKYYLLSHFHFDQYQGENTAITGSYIPIFC